MLPAGPRRKETIGELPRGLPTGDRAQTHLETCAGSLPKVGPWALKYFRDQGQIRDESNEQDKGEMFEGSQTQVHLRMRSRCELYKEQCDSRRTDRRVRV